MFLVLLCGGALKSTDAKKIMAMVAANKSASNGKIISSFNITISCRDRQSQSITSKLGLIIYKHIENFALGKSNYIFSCMKFGIW
jgi:hypothetical protein